MKIDIIDGTYTRDDNAATLLTRTEEEYLAALAQKLVVRQKHKMAKKLEEEARELAKIERQKEKERLKLEKQQEEERKRRETINRLLSGERDQEGTVW